MSLMRRMQGNDEGDDKGKRDAESQQPQSEAVYKPASEPSTLLVQLRQKFLALIELPLKTPETIQEWVITALGKENVVVSRTEQVWLTETMIAEVIGFGPLELLMTDEAITEIMVNAPDTVYVILRGRNTPTNITFDSVNHALQILERMIGHPVDENTPLIEAYLPDGSRLNAVLPPLANSLAFTIRKAPKTLPAKDDLIRFGTLTAQVTEFLKACVMARLNILICGNQEAGKTALLNMLASFIPAEERIVALENLPELRLRANALQLKTSSKVSMQQLIAQALRMRPDRLIIGDIRGAEALDLIQAVNNGLDGTISTIFAASGRDALHRLESKCLQSNLALAAVRVEIASAVDIIVTIERLPDGSRKVTQVTQVHGLEGEILILSNLFEFEQTRIEAGKIIGQLRPTGILLKAQGREKMENAGIHLPPQIFGLGYKGTDQA